jgi:hypothetical protein
MNWDAENRRTRLRRWNADNHGVGSEFEPPPRGDDAWDQWARRQVAKSVNRVRQASLRNAGPPSGSESEMLECLESAQRSIERGDNNAARTSLNEAANRVQQARTGSLDRATTDAVLAALSLMWAISD